MKYIIAGCPRSGTTFVSKLLTSGGHPTNHEGIFGMAGYGQFYTDMEGEASWLAVPFVENEKKKGTKIVHLLRHPLKTISSLMHTGFFSYRSFQRNMYTMFVKCQFPFIEPNKELDRYLYFWIYWNDIVKQFADFTYRVEDLDKDITKIFKDLELDVVGDKLHTNKKTNTHGKVKQVTMDTFKDCRLLDKFIEVAKGYGYNLKKP